MLEDKKLDKDTNRKVDDEWNIREAINIFDSWLHYQVVISSWKICDLSSMQ